jgi:serine/threonine protein kinase
MPATTDDRLLGGPYRLGEPLGHGGMGVVWAGRDELLGRDVAVKEVVPPHDLAADDREKLFRRTLREARAAARISSAAAVTVFDVVEEDGRPWIVMERLAARSLADVIAEEGPLPARRAAELGLDVLDALQAAASVGVLHRDVKPANVMLLRSTGRAVLTDFGIATLEGDATVTTTGLLLGSPAYMSPERARGEPATLASDLWSLGATLYAAIDGRSPFERSGSLPTLHAVMHDPAPVLAHSGELSDVIAALLTKDPAGRPSLGETRAALQQRVLRQQQTHPLPRLPGVALPTPPPPPESASDFGDTEQSALESWLEAPAEAPPSRDPRRRLRALLAVLAGGLLITATFVGFGALVDGSRQSDEGERPSESQSFASSGAVRQSPVQTPDVAPSGPPVEANPPPTNGQADSQETGAGAGASGASVLPAGFRLHTDPTGFTLAMPDGWTRSTDGPRTYFREPDGGRFLLVDQTTEPKEDPLADWEAQELSVAARLSGYERISLQRVDYRGWDAADWEFTWEGRNGQIHVLNRNVRVSDQRAYALYWSTPESQWTDSRELFDVIAQSFQPASG